jgi:hypothetical protein
MSTETPESKRIYTAIDRNMSASKALESRNLERNVRRLPLFTTYPMNTLKRTVSLFAIAGFLSLAGCKTTEYEKENKKFTDSFAQISNYQILLNIARLTNGEPTYFIQPGNFSAQYTYQGTLTAPGAGTAITRNNGAATEALPDTASIMGGAVTPTSTLELAVPNLGLQYTEAPNFTFAPLSGDTVAKLTLTPISTQAYQTAFSGWHADTAIRTIVASISLLPPPERSVRSHSAVLHVDSPPVNRPLTSVQATKPNESSPGALGDPSDTQATVGDTVTFSAKGTLDFKTFRWEVSMDKGTTWSDVADGLVKASGTDPDQLATYQTSQNAGTATLKIANITKAMDTWRYRCNATEGQRVPVVLRNDPRDESYVYFLAVAQEVYLGQLGGLIPAPYTSPKEKEEEEKKESAAQKDAISLDKVRLAEVIAADTAGFAVEQDSAKGAAQTFKVYKKATPSSESVEVKFADAELLKNLPILHWMVVHNVKVDVKLRTFNNALYNVSKEEERFGAIQEPTVSGATYANLKALSYVKPVQGVEDPPVVKYSKTTEADVVSWNSNEYIGGRISVAGAKEDFEARPILRISRYVAEDTIASLEHTWSGKKRFYKIGDLPGQITQQDLATVRNQSPSVTNKTEFALLTYLFNQASIDSSKLPQQQLVQVR